MATSTTDINITELPLEMQEQIFSYLKLSDRKTASLVCQLWNELIFSQWSMRKVVLNITKDCTHSQISALRGSTRVYRKVFAFFEPETCCEYQFSKIIAVLDLLGLTVESFCCKSNLTIHQLWHVVIRAPNLRQLIVGVDNASFKLDPPEFPVLQNLENMGSLFNALRIKNLDAPNLRQLRANLFQSVETQESLAFLRKVAPRLKSLELDSTEYFLPIDEFQFPEVEVLKLSGNICNTSDVVLQQFFDGFKNLTEVKLEFIVKESALDVITKACPGIVKLHLRTYMLGVESFRLLERLKRLKILSLAGSINVNGTVESKPLVLKNLNQLEELTLHCMQTSLSFVTTNANLKRLKIKRINKLYDSDLLEISQVYPNLQYLELIWCYKLTESGIEKFKSKLPDCVVRYLKNPVIYMNFSRWKLDEADM